LSPLLVVELLVPSSQAVKVHSKVKKISITIPPHIVRPRGGAADWWDDGFSVMAAPWVDRGVVLR
jgi:hypothetical protein